MKRFLGEFFNFFNCIEKQKPSQGLQDMIATLITSEVLFALKDRQGKPVKAKSLISDLLFSAVYSRRNEFKGIYLIRVHTGTIE